MYLRTYHHRNLWWIFSVLALVPRQQKYGFGVRRQFSV
jgi:hypothetical protein